jgi:hypothetical protein
VNKKDAGSDPNARTYCKARINDADEYQHVIAWAFHNIIDRETITDYVLHAGRNKGKGERKDIAHRCHNRACFSPFHLVKTTPTANDDMDGCIYGTLFSCPHNQKEPFVKFVFKKCVHVGDTFM